MERHGCSPSRIASIMAGVVICLVMSGCTKSGEAKTRAAQEEAFRANFDFMPPASVTEIKYADYYQRGVVDGAYDQWMKFTFQAGVFEQIVKKNGYQKAEERFKVPGHDKLNWWPADNHGGYVREGNDGASYSAQLWHDEKTGFVYWHQSWAD